jgi:hypothetical protein
MTRQNFAVWGTKSIKNEIQVQQCYLNTSLMKLVRDHKRSKTWKTDSDE